ncbi:cell division protein SepF [Synechococcus sp. UW140]|uniref:cell division protein SepF n=1 Tax=Synechococcus sp. UW140 TaxID=368503 RepID=UPI00313801A7
MEPEFCFLPPKLLILHCSKHADAFIAGAAIREQKSVLINTQAMEPKAAQRLLDFVAGAVHALSGNALRISADCFLFTPYQVLVDLMPSDESDFVHT